MSAFINIYLNALNGFSTGCFLSFLLYSVLLKHKVMILETRERAIMSRFSYLDETLYSSSMIDWFREGFDLSWSTFHGYGFTRVICQK